MVKTMSTRRPSLPMLVRDVMLPLDRMPVVEEKQILKEALETMGRFRLGIACIVDSEKRLLGILTDGDIRRKLLKVQKPFSAFFVDDALEHAIHSPLTTSTGDALAHAVDVMGEKQVWDLPVVDEGGHLVGLLHLHPAVQALLEAQG
jgi:DeoR family transcriptional regulator, catabolite repression regulator